MADLTIETLISKQSYISNLYTKYKAGQATEAEQAELVSLLTEVKTRSDELKQKIKPLVESIVDLKIQRDTDNVSFVSSGGPKKLAQLQSELDTISTATKVLSASAASAAPAAALIQAQKELEQSAIQAALAAKNKTLSFTTYSDYYDYIISTQYLNLYKRDRACDTGFKELLEYLAVEFNEQSTYHKEVREILSNAVK